MSSKKEQPGCPCCGQPRHVSECRIFFDQLRASARRYSGTPGISKAEISDRYYAHHPNDGSSYWACDACLETGKAIIGVPEKQLFCDCPPHFAYFDREKVCRVCKEAFVFDKAEQKHWYEQCGFWVQATRVYCRKCQAAKKQRDRIAQLMSDFDYQDTDRLKEIVSFYLAQKEYDKARHHLTLGKKHRQRGSDEYAWLDRWAAEIKEIAKNKIQPPDR